MSNLKSTDTVRDTIVGIYASALGLNNPQSLDLDRSLHETMAIDSLDLAEVSVALEDAWQIELSDEEFVSLYKIRNAIEIVERKLKNRG